MFLIGVLMVVAALAMVAVAIVGPEAARIGLVGGALGVGLAGLLFLYLDAPRRRRPPPPGKLRARATILEASGTAGEVAGYQMVELTLEVRPKDGVPFQVRRQFSSGRLGRIQQGRQIDVVYDAADPQRLELG